MFDDPDPSYNPEDFSLEDNVNVFHISEIHAFEPEGRKKRKYLRNVGRQINAYSEFFDVDRISVLGDSGSIEDVEEVFSHVDDSYELWIVAGDEDKKDIEEREGWFSEATTSKPFDIKNDYTIFEEGYETTVNGHLVQASHHPRNTQRPNQLSPPDPRAMEPSEAKSENISPEEMFRIDNEQSLLERFFSVDCDSNEMKESRPLNTDADICLYDHVHMPYPRTIFDTAIVGLGGRSHNYQRGVDSMPERSFYVTSFGEELVHTLHFDADKNEIFEHEIFEFVDGDVEMFQVETPRERTNQSTYLSVQARFLEDQIDDEAEEPIEKRPDMWGSR